MGNTASSTHQALPTSDPVFDLDDPRSPSSRTPRTQWASVPMADPRSPAAFTRTPISAFVVETEPAAEPTSFVKRISFDDEELLQVQGPNKPYLLPIERADFTDAVPTPDQPSDAVLHTESIDEKQQQQSTFYTDDKDSFTNAELIDPIREEEPMVQPSDPAPEPLRTIITTFAHSPKPASTRSPLRAIANSPITNGGKQSPVQPRKAPVTDIENALFSPLKKRPAPAPTRYSSLRA